MHSCKPKKVVKRSKKLESELDAARQVAMEGARELQDIPEGLTGEDLASFLDGILDNFIEAQDILNRAIGMCQK